MKIRTATTALASILLGCLASISACESTPRAGASSPWDAELRAIVAEYQSWKRVSDTMRSAPTDCRFVPLQGVARSQSESAETHGQKLYFLFVKDAPPYPTPTTIFGKTAQAEQPVGQAVVKQSFAAAPATLAEAELARTDRERSQHREVGERFAIIGHTESQSADGFTEYKPIVERATDPAGLFVMLKTAPETPNTDRGWVYATITPAGEITAAGRIQSCMNCHAEATYNRIFGAPWSNPYQTRAD